MKLVDKIFLSTMYYGAISMFDNMSVEDESEMLTTLDAGLAIKNNRNVDKAKMSSIFLYGRYRYDNSNNIRMIRSDVTMKNYLIDYMNGLNSKNDWTRRYGKVQDSTWSRYEE